MLEVGRLSPATSRVTVGVFLPGGTANPVQLCQHSPSCRQAEVRLRGFSSEARNTDVSYGQLKQLLAEGRAVVVDVREPWELREYGFIPGSVNVPLGQVNTALQLAPEEFRERYDGEMPRQTDNIVFVCLAGVRSKTALNTAASLGYRDVQHYPGGWQDWAEREQHQ